MDTVDPVIVSVGGFHKTNVYLIEYLWPSIGGYNDQRLLNSIESWLSKNVKTLNRKSPDLVAKELAAEFPQVSEVNVNDTGGKLAKWRRL